MPMPEAAVNEDGNPPGDEDDVGPPGKIGPMEPKPDAEPMEQTANDAFGRRVLPANGGHDAGTLSGSDPVHQQSKSKTMGNTDLR
jgi:hypothetical protein